MPGSCHRLVITASYFRAYSQTTWIAQRFKSVRAFLPLLDLLQVSGNIDAQHALEQREICRAFLMRLKLKDSDLDLKDSDVETDGFLEACPRCRVQSRLVV